MLHTLFRDYQHLFPHDLLVLLSLDCSKAYNRVGWSWLRRCLAASRLPEPLQRLLLAFLPGTVYLVFRGVETPAVRFFSGLAQGSPLSCFLLRLFDSCSRSCRRCLAFCINIIIKFDEFCILL